MTRRGYTLIELLGATALLTALTIAVASLIGLMVRDVPELTTSDRWHMSADATLRLLQSSDSEIRPWQTAEETSSITDQVSLSDGTLILVSGDAERILLGDVESFEISDDELSDARTIVIRSTHGEEVQRTILR